MMSDAEMHIPGAADAAALNDAWAAARRCGVTRLADITGLDRIGVPVFQAIRPMSRALAVHQGKALGVAGAQIGALMESVESAHAEVFDVRSAPAAHAQLPPTERPADLADFARDRDEPVGADEPIAWTPARRLLDGRIMQVPFECVSLDYTRPWDRRLDHTSSGLASRFDLEGALLKGLLEVLERDASAEWTALPDHFRSVSRIDRQTIGYPWFREIDARLRQAGVSLALYSLPTVIGLPALRAAALEFGVRRASRISTGGWGCARTWEEALQAAVLEALQARLTAISGVRDDILYFEPGERAWIGDAAPLPPGMKGLDWSELEGSGRDLGGVTSEEIAQMLRLAGYPDTAAVTLSAPGARVCVVKVFAPGLGANRRRRRQPASPGARP
jgi:ribosomal protein S12 methylthiotransferase accessory factor